MRRGPVAAGPSVSVALAVWSAVCDDYRDRSGALSQPELGTSSGSPVFGTHCAIPPHECNGAAADAYPDRRCRAGLGPYAQVPGIEPSQTVFETVSCPAATHLINPHPTHRSHVPVPEVIKPQAGDLVAVRKLKPRDHDKRWSAGS